MATVIEGFTENVCLVPHSLYIMLEMPGEAEVGGEGSIRGGEYEEKLASCCFVVSRLTEVCER